MTEDKKEPRIRDEALLRATIAKLCDFVWNGKTREHLWSIPADLERDFDIILSDAVDELTALRSKLATAEAIAEKERLAALGAHELIMRDAAFQEWAQGYLDAGRWAGHDRADAIRQTVLERDAELTALRTARESQEAFMEQRGYRRCDAAACNCGSWHGGHAEQRLREIGDSLRNAGVNGGTIHGGVLELIRDKEKAEADRDRLASEIAEAREACPVVRRQDFFDATLLQAVNHTVSRLVQLEADLARLHAELVAEECKHGETIDQRDRAEEWADKLAYALWDAETIGEHSNMNNPWEQALGLIEGLGEALRASEARIYPDANYETYLDDISRSAVDACSDAADGADDHLAALLRQMTEAMSAVRRSRAELRQDMERIGLAANLPNQE